MSPIANESTQEAHDMKHHGSAAKYLLIWAVLLVLTLVTVFTGRMHLPTIGLGLALAIASVKGTLVALYFMHLSEHQGANRLVFGVSILFVALMILGSIGDLATRFRLATPPGSSYSVMPPAEFLQSYFADPSARDAQAADKEHP